MRQHSHVREVHVRRADPARQPALFVETRQPSPVVIERTARRVAIGLFGLIVLHVGLAIYGLM